MFCKKQNKKNYIYKQQPPPPTKYFSYFLPIAAPFCLPDKSKGSFTNSFDRLVLFFKLSITGFRLLEVHGGAQCFPLTGLTNPLHEETSKWSPSYKHNRL